MKTKNFILSLYLILSTNFLSVATNDIVMINSNVIGRKYEGIGSLSAGGSSRLLIDYSEPYRSQILDYLFKSKFGASLNHLKTEIGGDINSTCGTESSHQHTRDDENYDRGYEWWLMKEAKKRNKDVVLDVLAWGAPSWIGNGNYYSDDLPEYMAKFLLGAKRIHNLDIDYIGIWNERPYNVDYIKQLKKTLNNYNLKTKIVAADEIRSYWIAKDILKDPDLYNVIDVIGTHYPHGSGKNLYSGKSVYDIYGKDYKIVWKEALDCGKPIWSLEDGPWNGEWNGAKGLIKVLIRNYINAKMVKTITWSLISSYHDNIGISGSGLMKANTPWSGQYEVQPALWAIAHVTQFAEPGWFYLEGGANGYLNNGGSYVSLMSPDKENVSVVIETVESSANETIRFNLDGPFADKAYYLWKSDSLNQFIKQKNVLYPMNGSLTLTLEKSSIYTLTTTVGQQKGNQNLIIPEATKFPLPYSDNFESYEVDKLPRYTSDISGVFEVTQVNNNKVLKQVVPSRGIEWMASLNSEPFTVIGDSSFVNYSISIDVRLENKEESAYLMGRIPYVRQGQVLLPMGYCLKVSTNGDFSLLSTMPALLKGRNDFRKKWPESNAFFPNQTQNSYIIPLSKVKQWPKERIKLFNGLDNVIVKSNNLDQNFLILHSNGSFSVYEQRRLASGKTNFKETKWNKLELSFQKNSIEGFVNGILVCKVIDNVYPKGYAGLGTGWNCGYFDNLKIIKK